MAFEMKIPQQGGVSHSKGYVRVTDVRISSKDDPKIDNFVMVDMACYSSKTKRDEGIRMISLELDKRKYAVPVDGNVSKDWAYAQLKADSTMSSIGAMTDV
jgi:hypothetical protein|tara:strand:- start:299 stop:601 length:303 start_codon:yes stop_codon:yes gene_type:complete